jgi:hypothetical protein
MYSVAIHSAGTRVDPRRDGHALRAVSGTLRRPVPAHLARRAAEKGQPKIPKAIQGMLDRGLVGIRANPMGRQAAFFTEAGLAGLRQLLRDPWAMDPERFAHLRDELEVDGAGRDER